jgi:hypothetical protein
MSTGSTARSAPYFRIGRSGRPDFRRIATDARPVPHAVPLRFQTINFAHAGEGAADVGNGDRATDDQRDIEGVNDFLALPALFTAADQVIRDAVVATQNCGSD